MPGPESQVSQCSKIWLPNDFQGMGYIEEKSLIMVGKGVGVMGSPD